jgi:hypothetical protein
VRVWFIVKLLGLPPVLLIAGHLRKSYDAHHIIMFGCATGLTAVYRGPMFVSKVVVSGTIAMTVRAWEYTAAYISVIVVKHGIGVNLTRRRTCGVHRSFRGGSENNLIVVYRTNAKKLDTPS